MIRMGNQIRLSDKEKKMFLRDTGATQAPKTVEDYNRQMAMAREGFESDDAPESRLMAMMMPDIEA